MLPPMLENKIPRCILQSCRHLCKEVTILHTLKRRPCMKQSTAPVDNLYKRKKLSSNTLSFIHSHSDQIMATAPTLIIFFKHMIHPFSPLPKIFATLRGSYKVEPIWITDHIDLANWKRKRRCL
jgi:hypothetical protein